MNAMHSAIARSILASAKCLENPHMKLPSKAGVFILRASSTYNSEKKSKNDDEFRVLQILPKKSDVAATRVTFKAKVQPPRAGRMPIDQDWANVWPGPRTFHPASVPLPVRQGYREKGAPPGKYANAELMKIPNFLHLTPPAIEKHCKALKQWCTPWPEELATDEDMDHHFPINVIAADYCHALPTIRDPQSRVVSIKIKLSVLKLDEHAKDKLRRLVGQRYDPITDILTLTTDSCPLKKQNYDYAMYILTALYHESWNVEPWESEKTHDDMEKYVWEDRPAREGVLATFAYNGRTPPDLHSVGKAVERLFNEGENEDTIEEYKKNMVKLLIE